jgi:GTPase SAR1 family protein
MQDDAAEHSGGYARYAQAILKRAPAKSDDEATLHIALVGAGGSGKTAYALRMTTGIYPSPQNAVVEVEYAERMHHSVTTVLSPGTKKSVEVVFHDAGSELSLSVCSVALVFFDGTRYRSELALREWLQRCDARGITTLLCCNKEDLKPAGMRLSKGGEVLVRVLWGSPSDPVARLGFCVSVRSMYNLTNPLLWALRWHLRDPELVIVGV